MTFSFFDKGEIAGRMFSDVDGDNTEAKAGGGYDAGLAGYTVKLYKANGTLVGTTTTNSTGYYTFGDVSAGDYYVQFPKTVDGNGLVVQEAAGSTYENDSDADPSTGKTMVFSVSKDLDQVNIDAGYKATPPAAPADGAVDGEGFGETMVLGYDDSNAPTDQGGDKITDGGDKIFGNGGNDTIDGAKGNDTIEGNSGDDVIKGSQGNDVIYGDGPGAGTGGGSGERESFEWDLNKSDVSGGFTQNTGSVDVTFKTIGKNESPETKFQSDTQKVHSITADGKSVDANSSMASSLNSDDEAATYQWAFSTQVANVSFRINDIDNDSKVVIKAYDLNGNLVAVDVKAESGTHLTLSDKDSAGGKETVQHLKDDNGSDTDPDHSVLVNIAGPLSRIEITHEQEGHDSSEINVTDIYFDALKGSGAGTGAGNGDDTIMGGSGDDTIYGNQGDDSLEGGKGNDVIYGDDGEDVNGGTAGPRESFNWQPVTESQADSTVTQNTGSVDVKYTRIKDTGAHDSGIDNSTKLNTSGIDGGSETVDNNSSLRSETQGKGNEGQFQWEFSKAVTDVDFNINDLDTTGRVTVKAWGPDGQPITVTLNGGSGMNLTDTDSVAGSDTATSTQGDKPETDASNNVQVSIAGPVSKIVVEHIQVGSTNSGIFITDMFFNAPGTAGDGMNGEGGNDTIIGGEGADQMYGEGGNDTFTVASSAEGAGDKIVGGNGPDDKTDNDVLDLRGAGKVTIDKVADDSDSGAYKGTVTFADGKVLTFSQIETFLTDPQNEAPDAVNDTASVDEDGTVTIDVLANDTDPDGDTLTITGVTGATNGTAQVIDGKVVYTPNPDFNGTETLTYTVTDPSGLTDTATITVTVNPVNDAPDAVNDVAVTDEDNAVTIDVLGNDTDVDGDPLTITGVTGATNGTTQIVDGKIVYTPNANFNGSETLTYTISDGNGGTDTATVQVTVNPVNDAPDAVNDVASTDENVGVTINVLANDTDVDGDPLTVTGVVGAVNGTAIVSGNQVVYTPNTGFSGTETLTYTISDGKGGTDTATITITVNDTIKPDGIVEGSSDPDTIDDAYDGDPNGDFIDNDDALDPTSGDDDLVYAYGGDDLVYAGSGEDTVYGGTGNDTIYGNSGDDTLLGESGDDSIRGQQGDDSIVGGLGDDALRGGSGDDTLDGGAGDDDLIGGSGDDSIIGGSGDDSIRGILGNDTIYGGDGNDSIDAAQQNGSPDKAGAIPGVANDPNPNDDRDSVFGGAGNDTINTGDDADTIYGGSGDDSITAGIDDDVQYGGAGNDTIVDVQGSDYVEGGSGDDVILVGTDTFSDYVGDDPKFPSPFFPGATSDPDPTDGMDTVYGGAGNDSIVTGDDADRIFGGSGEDTILAGIDDDYVEGGMGDDSIIGGHGSDTIYAGSGDDFVNGGDSSLLWGQAPDATDPVPTNGLDLIYGGTGNDTIYGEDDNDTIYGGSGDDELYGGIDNDSIIAGGGQDTVYGGQGNDTITGDSGEDLVYGGSGDDSIEGTRANDTIYGDSGNDTLRGNREDDVLYGGSGDDSIDGGGQNDTIVGGAGADMMFGANDRDLFLGATVGDTIDGGSGGDDYDTLDLRGSAPAGGRIKVIYDTNPENGTVEFYDATDTLLGSAQFEEIEKVIPCFTPGTLIATPRGEVPVENLKVGDRVITRDNGIQEIRWLGFKALEGRELLQKEHLKPVLIQKGSLGYGLPERDMLVSPNHRVLVNNDKTALYFEEREVLVAAKHLTGLAGVDRVDTMRTTYVHFMFDQHEVVLSDGSWTESFQPGHQTLDGLGNAQRQEILELFPELATEAGREDYHAARRTLKKHEAKLLTK